MPTTASYGGSSLFNGCIFPFQGGTQPSCCTLFGPPQVLPRTGTLQISHTELGVNLSFPGMVLQEVSEIGQWSAYHLQDRRRLMAGGSFRGEWNVPIAGGPAFLRERTPHEIASQLLDSMGEDGYDVSALPNAARPYVRGEGEHPAVALENFCSSLGCYVTLKLDNTIAIVQAGTGQQAPTTNQILQPLQYTAGDVPVAIEVEYDPTIYQSWLKLEAVTWDFAEDVMSDLAAGERVPWIGQPDLAGFGAARLRAEKSDYRFYRIADTHPGPNVVPGLGAIVDIAQVIPLVDTRVDTYTGPLGVGLKPARIMGKFHTAQYCGITHADLTEYSLPFRVHAEHGLVEFDRPVFQTGVNGRTEPCEELYLDASYRVMQPLTTGDYVRNVRSQNQAGDVFRQEHRIHQPLFVRHIATYTEAGALLGVTTNEAQVDAISDSLINAVQPILQERTIQPKRNSGILAVEIDGIIRQVTWGFGLPVLDHFDGAAQTWIGGNCKPYGFIK